MLGVVGQQCCFRLNVAKRFDRFQTLRNNSQTTRQNNMQQSVQTDATCNIQQCWELFADLRQFTRGFFLPYLRYVGLVSFK